MLRTFLTLVFIPSLLKPEKQFYFLRIRKYEQKGTSLD